MLVRIADLFNEGGIIKNIDKFYDLVRNRPWLKRETYIYQYGYYYALSATAINLTTVYG